MKPLNYPLEESKIAIRPLENRSDSKLLIYKDGDIITEKFKNLAQILPEKSHLFLNNTKVIEARILLQKPTGAKIELLLLEPYDESGYPFDALHYTDQVYWKALIGGASKFKTDQAITKIIQIDGRTFPVYFEKIRALEDGFLVKIHWENPNPEQYSFSEILPVMGETPIPPYLNRESEALDTNRYQTIYAKKEGSVAAPTSSLHYDKQVFERLMNAGIQTHELTLHVGAGTFMPIKTEEIEDHHMHQEWMQIELSTIQQLIHIFENQELVIASGTTSARFLESLYWLGVYVHEEQTLPSLIDQNFIKSNWEHSLSALESMQTLESYWLANDINNYAVATTIFIYPPYQYRMLDALITNFHQPQSTLLLLVATLVGDDWEKIYHYALENDYRFLSYGDSSILFGSKNK